MTYLEAEDIRKVAELPYDWKRLDGKSIMISGGSGFIGSFITEVVRYRNIKYGSAIKVISLSRRGGFSDSTVESICADVTCPVVYEGEVNYILHLASNTHPKQYGEDPVGTITTNIIGCDNLLKLAVEKKAVFLLTSSVEIYGQGTPSLMDEHYCGYIDCNNARNGYNEAKRTSEALCQSYKKQYGVDVRIARLARVFGADRKADSKAMSQFIGKAVAGEDIVLKSSGSQRFSYCYIADAVSGIMKILLDGVDGEAYNVADDEEGFSLGEYACYIAELAKRNVIYDIQADETTSKATYALMSTLKLKKIGWKPLYSVREGIKRTFQICSAFKEMQDQV